MKKTKRFESSHPDNRVAANILAFDLFQRHLSPKPELPIFNQGKVGDLYRSFHDISNRKKQQVKFVCKLEEKLIQKIEELDGFYPDN